ncbi:HupE/UreJ family protein [Photobacterium carnosum]|jgi:urease accessory protein|uniref:Urease accessory protein n=1 Tax=Photobacterium carnosum TaxID=2023717 RepID=A0A2N4US87_9GAMM|nr:HupE/UreJ family protein [Photobacterium carnosum]KAE8177834.1 urease accessory protein [Photobacterium carnosum]MBY3787789.1 HupE/UreJ family protein [Photobacterium carnosum]MCD9495761.1 urease accessory protein [Photobacterium carnosum]MCD9514803.1 urease accessory protein [Photobacterium carnosum]MCD9524112.1 urease accessory protein [Photobacterium carnosum]
MKFKHVITGALTLFSPLALAHPGHIGPHSATGFMTGFVHPFTGLDHLSVMIGVGLLAALIGGKAVSRLPMAFIGIMVVGGALGVAGMVLPGVEMGIALSVLGMGAMLLAGGRMSEKVATGLVMAFALFHGMAHGMEMPLDAQALEYFSGFVVATAILHVSGIALGKLVMNSAVNQRVMRVVGVVMAAFGGILMLS